MIITRALAILIIPLLLCGCRQPDPVRIGLLLTSEADSTLTEIKGAMEFLEYLSPTPPFTSPPENLSRFDILWLHFPDSSMTDRLASDTAALENISQFVHQGGKILLTLNAIRLLNDLGFEDTPVQSQTVALVDEGYGRKAGLHAFLEHPLFDGLNGGAFIFDPAKDTACTIHGFFAEMVPAQGRVIAVDWSYIFLKEQNKLVVEYTPGKGRVIAVGGYTLFSPVNANRAHLELFMKNAFDDLMNEQKDKPANYWNYAPQQVREIRQKSRKKTSPVSAGWETKTNLITLMVDSASSDFWDLASPRLVIMGKENGGIDEIWAHPFMAFRDYEAGIRLSSMDSTTWLNTLMPQLEIDPAWIRRNYRLQDGFLYEIIALDPDEPVAVIHYEWVGNQTAELIIRCTSNLRLMWPYSEKVIQELNYRWDTGLQAMTIADGSGRFTALMGSNKHPLSWHAGRFERIEIGHEDFTTIPTSEFQVQWIVRYPLMSRDYLDMILAASNEGEEKTLTYYHQALRAPEAVCDRMASYVADVLTDNLLITTPDEAFNLGYRWALVGTDRFFVNTPGIGGSLVAGYGTTQRGWDGGHRINGRPGYAWYFGRDGQWSGFALLGYGDFEKVRSILEVYQRFQDLNGKIYHELTTSGVVHYDAADATPLYIILAGRYLRHSGDTAFIHSSWSNIQKAIDFCFSTDTDGDHLIENTNVGHGWVEGGRLYGSHTSLYLASCWAEALKEAAYMAEKLGYETFAAHYLAESTRVIQIINRDFWNPATGFFHQGRFSDGSYHEAATLLSAIPLYFGQSTTEKNPSILNVLAGNGFSSDWGVRIISSESPWFHPRAYHAGTVWPLFTGWAALAGYKQGAPVHGFTHIMNNVLIKEYWAKGFIEEVLHGLEYRPSGVCAHQCWSETMVLQPAIEGMLGLEVFAPDNRLKLSPQFPFDWDSVVIENIRMGDQTINMDFRRTGNKWTYHFTGDGHIPVKIEFSPLLPAGAIIQGTILNGKAIRPDVHTFTNGVRLDVAFDLHDTCLVEVSVNKGIGVLPYIPHPQPGDSSEGFRIISAQLVNDHYHLIVEGPAGKSGMFSVYAADDQKIQATGINKLKKIRNGYQIEINFEASDKPFVKKEVILALD